MLKNFRLISKGSVNLIAIDFLQARALGTNESFWICNCFVESPAFAFFHQCSVGTFLSPWNHLTESRSSACTRHTGLELSSKKRCRPAFSCKKVATRGVGTLVATQGECEINPWFIDTSTQEFCGTLLQKKVSGTVFSGALTVISTDKRNFCQWTKTVGDVGPNPQSPAITRPVLFSVLCPELRVSGSLREYHTQNSLTCQTQETLF